MKYDPSGKNSSGAPSNTASTVTPASRANRASSPNRRLRAPALSLCQPTRCAITLLPSTRYDIAPILQRAGGVGYGGLTRRAVWLKTSLLALTQVRTHLD